MMDEVKQKRIVKSREHSAEEKRLQKKRWRNRKKQKNRMARLKSNELEASAKPSQIVSAIKERPRERKEHGQSQLKEIPSRGRLLVDIARRTSRKRLCEEQATSTVAARVEQGATPGRKKPKTVIAEKPSELKYLDSKLLNYKSDKQIGSGTYGECFLAEYKGIDVVVKKMKIHGKDIKKAKRDVIHEGKIITALGDHEGLPLLFGVVTDEELCGLVLKFHEVDAKNLTLSRAASTNLLSESHCIHILVNVCTVLHHIHSRGYLHNDLKGNNIILERRGNSRKYFPILIDFGKSRKKDTPEMRRRQSTAGNSYLAPEVIDGGKQSTASDVYSLGQMMKVVAAHFRRKFYSSILRVIVQKATTTDAASRPTVEGVKAMLEQCHIK